MTYYPTTNVTCQDSPLLLSLEERYIPQRTCEVTGKDLPSTPYQGGSQADEVPPSNVAITRVKVCILVKAPSMHRPADASPRQVNGAIV